MYEVALVELPAPTIGSLAIGTHRNGANINRPLNAQCRSFKRDRPAAAGPSAGRPVSCRAAYGRLFRLFGRFGCPGRALSCLGRLFGAGASQAFLDALAERPLRVHEDSQGLL